jgi:hypothetical protein
MRDRGREAPSTFERAQVSIPLFDVPGSAAEALMDLASDRLATLIAGGRRRYGSVLLAWGDQATWQWLERTANPYRLEIDRVRRRLGQPGAVLLNMSYEWCCTAGVGPDPVGDGCRMLRTLDWPMSGLGEAVVISRQTGGAGGVYFSVTWPGYVGVLTGMAPGRFCAAINQPPLRRFTPSCRLDWLVGRIALWRRDGLPPSHLLRRVFDECVSYDDAKSLLISEPLCLPAFFSLAGVEAGQGCVIERQESSAVVHEAPRAISNHWIGVPISGHDRGHDSVGRRAAMRGALETASNDLSWLVPPIRNETTRLAVMANAATGALIVQGWERGEAATSVFTLTPAANETTRSSDSGAVA